jgi:hypothetical protein
MSSDALKSIHININHITDSSITRYYTSLSQLQCSAHNKSLEHVDKLVMIDYITKKKMHNALSNAIHYYYQVSRTSNI